MSSPGDAGPAGSPRPPEVSGRARILVIDDEPLVARTLSRILRGAYEVLILHKVADALALFAGGERFDAILCDLMMPEQTGMDFYGLLGEIAAEQRERIIFITGGAFTNSADDFLLHVPNLRLNKPFETQEVRDAVEAVLGEQASRRSPGSAPK